MVKVSPEEAASPVAQKYLVMEGGAPGGPEGPKGALPQAVLENGSGQGGGGRVDQGTEEAGGAGKWDVEEDRAGMPPLENIKTNSQKLLEETGSKAAVGRFNSTVKANTQHDFDLRHMEKTYEVQDEQDGMGSMLESLEAQLADAVPAWRKKLIIDPRGRRMLAWDLFIMAMILYVLMVTPYDVTFLDLEYDTMFAINQFVDACFLVDFIMSFNIMYRDPQKGWVTNGRLLALNYLKGWCFVDLLGNIPWDVMQLELWPRCGLDELANSRMRVLRMMKLLRLLRTPRVVKRLESKVSIDYGILTILQFLGITVVASHWLACLFGIIPVLEQADRSWTETIVNDGWSDTPGRRYAEALYFAVYTITSAGYGDVVPQTQIEIYVAIFILYFGVYFFGYIIGTITNVVASRNEAQTRFHKMMDDLTAFMEENSLPAALRQKLRDYFRYRASSQGTRDFHGLLSLMSMQLRGEVAAHTSSNWIKDLKFFQDCPEEFYIEIAMALRTETFAPREPVVKLGSPPNGMYIVQRGVCASEGMIFTRGMCFGTDMLTEVALVDSMEGRSYRALALTFTDILVLDIMSLRKLLVSYPQVEKILRRAVIKATVRSELIAYARAVRLVVTGKRSPYARLAGDPGGREAFYARKLEVLVGRNEEELARLRNATTMIQARFRGVRERRQVEESKELEKNPMLKALQAAGVATGSPTGGRGSGGSPFARLPSTSASASEPGSSKVSAARSRWRKLSGKMMAGALRGPRAAAPATPVARPAGSVASATGRPGVSVASRPGGSLVRSETGGRRSSGGDSVMAPNIVTVMGGGGGASKEDFEAVAAGVKGRVEEMGARVDARVGELTALVGELREALAGAARREEAHAALLREMGGIIAAQQRAAAAAAGGGGGGGEEFPPAPPGDGQADGLIPAEGRPFST